MQSIIIINKNSEKRQKYIQNFCADHEISQFDQTIISEEGSIGIKTVRDLQEKVFLKPFQSKEKAIILDHAQNLTIEAQNALLKILEEPPLSTYIFLSATTAEQFLPTILSRCTILVLDTKEHGIITDEEKNQYTSILVYLHNASLGEKLALAEEVGKDKTKAIQWLEKAIMVAREEMISPGHSQLNSESLVKHLKLFQQTHTIINTTNVNPRFAMENLFLQML